MSAAFYKDKRSNICSKTGKEQGFNLPEGSEYACVTCRGQWMCLCDFAEASENACDTWNNFIGFCLKTIFFPHFSGLGDFFSWTQLLLPLKIPFHTGLRKQVCTRKWQQVYISLDTHVFVSASSSEGPPSVRYLVQPGTAGLQIIVYYSILFQNIKWQTLSRSTCITCMSLLHLMHGTIMP